MIGGAGYSYPKHFISNNLDKNMDVVEIDRQITEIAKKYFYLDTLLDEFDIKNTKRLNLITEDGRVFLNKNKKKYDVILNDAFSGNVPAPTLTTIEAIKHIKNSLNNNGLYMSNIISTLEGSRSRFLKAEVNTLSKVFKNVYTIPCVSLTDINLLQNFMVIATDQDLSYPNTYELQLSENEIILTDTYCPVEQLSYFAN
jgi:spermidine synthase